MKKLLPLLALVATHTIIAKRSYEGEAKQTRVTPKKIIKKISHADCIDNAIDILSSLEQEHNMQQSAQQEATSSRLDLEDLNNDSPRPHYKKIASNEISPSKHYETEFKHMQDELTSEKQLTDDALAQVKELQRMVDHEQHATMELKQANAQLHNQLAERTTQAQEFKEQLIGVEKELEHNKRLAFDAQALLTSEKDSWQQEKAKLEEQIKRNEHAHASYLESAHRVAHLEDSLAKAQEELKKMAGFEQELKMQISALKESQDHAHTAAAMKEEADKKIHDLTAHIAQLEAEKQNNNTLDLERNKVASVEHNKALVAKINTQMNDLMAQLSHIQTLLPNQQ